MASAESVALLSGHDDDDDSTDDGFDSHSHPNSHNLSRLSVCTSSLSRLSIESFDADADEDVSDDNNNNKPRRPNPNNLDFICSSDEEPGECYSLPATPPRRRNRVGMLRGGAEGLVTKEYVSENDGVGSKAVTRQKWRRNPRSRSLNRNSSRSSNCDYGLSGESENGGGMVVITRPKGGRRSLCMDLGEVKACKDLGFELEHERMVELPPGRVSGTSSGGDSPIPNWRISSPGDDPRDVKGRLKAWAHAVAMVSAPTKRGGGGGGSI
ncbi:hypothetical protein LINGRAHAP2_LOCUS15031 [Linum grandiflorum]